MTGFTESIWTALQLVTSGDAVLWSVVRRSLAVSATACVLACGLGLWLGAWLAVSRFKGRGLVLAGLNTLLALPSVVVGLDTVEAVVSVAAVAALFGLWWAGVSEGSMA